MYSLAYVDCRVTFRMVRINLLLDHDSRDRLVGEALVGFSIVDVSLV